MAAPVEPLTWELECWRLQKLYGDGLLVDGSVLKVTHRCTDPDWDAEWAEELQLEVRVPAGYPSRQSGEPALAVIDPDEKLPFRFKELVPKLFDEGAAQCPEGVPVVYRALQHTDRFLVTLWLKIRYLEERAREEAAVEEIRKLQQARREKEEAEKAEAAAKAAAERAAAKAKAEAAAAQARAAREERVAQQEAWTLDEQERLEAAITELREEADLKKRWKLIAQSVGGSRSAQQCADRFQTCRERALEEQAPERSEEPQAPSTPDPRRRPPVPALPTKLGEPLPDTGVCKHYKHSQRWFRFPCCGQAFPCDACHDSQADHPYEWASRMICGFCSYEQPVNKSGCTRCAEGQAKGNTAFWQGGQGHRNQATMSKKDSHKYKGLSK